MMATADVRRQVFQRNTLLALAKLGRTPIERAKWLVSFLSRDDLADAPAPECDRLRWQLIAWGFADPAGLIPIPIEDDATDPLGTQASPPVVQVINTTDAAAPAFAALPQLDAEDARQVVVAWQAYLDGLLTRVLTSDGGFAAVPVRVAHYLERQSDGRIVRHTTGAPHDVLHNALSDLLVAVGPRLRICGAKNGKDRTDVCGRLFVAERRQVWCSRRCAQREHTATWERTHPRGAAAEPTPLHGEHPRAAAGHERS